MRGDNGPRPGEGIGSTVGGAVVGGLLAGPFGAFFGAQLGANAGANRRAQREARERLERMGLTEDDLAMAQNIAVDLQEAEDSLRIVTEAAEGAERLASRLRTDVDEAYDRARQCLLAEDEDGARKWLQVKSESEAKLPAAEAELEEARARVQRMEDNVRSISSRAAELDAFISRSVAAATEQAALEESEARDAYASSLDARRYEFDDPPPSRRGRATVKEDEEPTRRYGDRAPIEDPMEERWRKLEGR